MSNNPLQQFEITTIQELSIAGINASFTNASLFMAVIVLSIWAFISLGMSRAAMVPGRWQSMVELSYEFISNMLHDAAGAEARKFFPFIFSLFMFILFANLIGMIPGAFTVTSHLVVTFAFAAVVFLMVTITGLIKNGLGFFKLFVPSGVPLPLLLLIVPIEFISYLVRPVSLSVRLFANMVAGHTMLKVLAGFVASLGVMLGWAPVLFNVALTGLEVFVAILQAYVFAMLSCIYLHDAFHVEH